jgi:hypothetical protein
MAPKRIDFLKLIAISDLWLMLPGGFWAGPSRETVMALADKDVDPRVKPGGGENLKRLSRT